MSQTIDPIAPASTMPDPEWIRVKQAIAWCGISQTKLYGLMGERKIKSVTLRERGDRRGTRLISFPSLKGFLESKATGGEPDEKGGAK